MKPGQGIMFRTHADVMIRLDGKLQIGMQRKVLVIKHDAFRGGILAHICCETRNVDVIFYIAQITRLGFTSCLL